MGGHAPEQGLRIDKWLWAARFFKTRGRAVEAVNGGKVHVNGQRVKPARAVRVGDLLSIRRGDEEWIVEICDLQSRRGPAPEARRLYRETQASIAQREQHRAQRRAQSARMPHPRRRPDKKQRRQIIRFRRGES